MVKKFCTQPGLLFLAACLQQGSDKEKETEKPVEQEEKVSETPRGEVEMSMVAAETASPAWEGVGSLITLGSLIEFWGPEGPPQIEKPLKSHGLSIGI